LPKAFISLYLTMNFNVDFEAIGNAFVQHYYRTFDNPDPNARTAGLSDLYDPLNSYMTFEGVQVKGRQAILEKFASLPFRSIKRAITKTDCQPFPDGSVIIAVMGQLQVVKIIYEPFFYRFYWRLVISYLSFVVMFAMNTKLGKTATRGQKQIHEENMTVLRSYSLASGIIIVKFFYFFSPFLHQHFGNGCVDLLAFFWYKFYIIENAEFDYSYIEFAFAICVILQIASLLTMRSMAKCVRNEKGQITDAGLDLNQNDSFGEYCKDIIIICCFTLLVGCFWSKIFWLLLIIPAFIFYKLWTTILAPWFFVQPVEEDDSKKLKKKEKKLRRM
uniref:Transmembrane protein 208 n=1 Tax=Dracunculus medinensis TaxID=318479 RepID=A0A0N4U8L9_DRAME